MMDELLELLARLEPDIGVMIVLVMAMEIRYMWYSMWFHTFFYQAFMLIIVSDNWNLHITVRWG